MSIRNGPLWDRVLKLAVLLLIGFELWLVQVVIPDFYSQLFHLTLAGDIDGLIRYISSFGAYAAAISVFMITLTDTTGLPAIPFLTVNGAIFGLLPGLILSWIGEVLGTELNFIILRTVLRREALRVISRHHLRTQMNKYSNVRTLTIARAIPYIPNIPFTALAAVSPISLKDHTIATAVGKIPHVVIEVWLGHDLIYFSQHSERLVFWVAAAAVICYLWKRHH
ncbi:TVP38/TMEM64 family protein [Megasphaera sp.]|uniref:TVP38/TMEM64 family protein n=1 Tax=Megasphaera sp. TaxID=2023260 RepID=UPI0025D544BC|nr:VTT domain-containing protein [uncultured Megasphaera sp.]